MAIIHSPDPYYNGTIGTTSSSGSGQATFRDGVTVTDDPAVIAFCRAAGYAIEEPEAEEPTARSPKRERPREPHEG
jgi:hypothetical protein